MKGVRKLRYAASERKYQAYLSEKRSGCPFCFTDGLPREVIKKYKFWYVTNNLFPYDLNYSRHDMLVPIRHVNSFWDLDLEELNEYLEIRKEIPEMGYDELLENMPKIRSQKHLHQHLLQY
jgi:diadenosine tetraphosphate (Ap4A) HIT family hydrolase